MYALQPDIDIVAAVFALETERHAPTLRKNSQDVRKRIHRTDWSTPKRQDLVAIPQPAPKGVRSLEDIRNNDPPLLVMIHRRAQRRMIDDATAPQVTEKILHLIDRDGIADANIDP